MNMVLVICGTNKHFLNKDETFIISLFKHRMYDVFLLNNDVYLYNVSNTRLYKHINVYHVNNSYLDSIKEKYVYQNSCD